MTGSFEPRTAMAILLDEIAPEVAAVRYELDPSARGRIPLHITLLHPFVVERELTAALTDDVRAFFAARPRPTFSLARVDAFPEDVVYAAPEPAAALIDLIGALATRYPETPPYGGAYDEPVPHATLASLDDVDLAVVGGRLDPLLPVRCDPDCASLIAEYARNRWHELVPLPFGRGA